MVSAVERCSMLATVSSGTGVPLAALAPEEVFRRCWARSHAADPSPAHLAAFHELLEAPGGDEGEEA